MANTGTVGWVDLTVDDAAPIRDFYAAVLGWTAEGLDMGGYDDYVMRADEEPAAGICHRRGSNADLPPQWIVYFTVPDLAEAVRVAIERGGEVLSEGSYALLRDPSGALFALTAAPPDENAPSD